MKDIEELKLDIFYLKNEQKRKKKEWNEKRKPVEEIE